MKTNEVLENIKARRSVRAYTSRPLECAFTPNNQHINI